MRLRKTFVTLVTGAVVLLGVPAQAATPAQIEQAIASGVAWLASRQNANGSFGSSYPVGETGLAVWKLCDRARELGQDPLAASYAYQANVRNGLNYLFGRANVTPLTDVDGNGDGQAVRWTDYETYDTSLALAAIAACQNQAAVVNVPGSAVDGWTHAKVAQNAVDFLLYGQGDSGCAEGGWGYSANYSGWSDQSNTGYVTFALKLASDVPPFGFDLTIPQVYIDRLGAYIDAVQDPVDGSPDGYDGGSWYEPCITYKWVNILKTGHLLAEMALVGDTPTAPRVQNAKNYIQNRWAATGPQPEFSSTSLGWKDDYQAMFTMMKGLTLIGIETLTVGGSAINWFDEVSTQIVNTQNADGSWPTTSYEGGESSQVLTTAWALLVLERAVGEAPAPASAGLAAPALSAFGLMVLTALLAMVGIWLVRERSRRGSDLIG